MESVWNRRDFVRLTGLVGVAMQTSVGRAQNLTAGAAPGPGGLTALALADDVARLAAYSEGGPGIVASSLTLRPELVRLGSAVPNAKLALGLLEQVRQGAPGARARFALAAGWLVHGALENERASALEGLSVEEAAERLLYQDVMVLRETTFSAAAPCGSGRPAPEAAIAAAAPSDVASLFQVVNTRLLIGIHTFNPDMDDITGWMREMKVWNHRWRSLLKQYAAVYKGPDPSKWRRHVEEAQFYDVGDPAVALCRSLQKGGVSTKANTRAALGAAPRGMYAVALREGLKRVGAAGEYAAGLIDRESVVARLGVAASRARLETDQK